MPTLGDKCQLASFCAPFGRGVGICIFLKINLSKEYSQLTVWDIFDSWRHLLVLDISCQLLGDECKLDSFCAPFGRGDGKCTFLELHIDMKSNSLGHFRQLEAFVGIGYIMPTIWGNISWWFIYVDTGYIMPTLGG